MKKLFQYTVLLASLAAWIYLQFVFFFMPEVNKKIQNYIWSNESFAANSIIFLFFLVMSYISVKDSIFPSEKWQRNFRIYRALGAIVMVSATLFFGYRVLNQIN